MKHLLKILIVLIIGVLIGLLIMYSQKTKPNYVEWLLDDINNGDYDRAVDYLPCIYDWNIEGNYNVDSVICFMEYADSINVPTHLIDSLGKYIYLDLDDRGCTTYQIDNGLAFAYYLNALKVSQQIYETFPGYYIYSLTMLGNISLNAMEYDNAEAYYLQAFSYLNRFEILNKDDSLYNAMLFQLLGKVYHAKIDISSAKTYYQASIRIYETYMNNMPNDSKLEFAETLNNIGNIYSEDEDYYNAESCYLRSANIKKYILGANHQEYALTLLNLSLLYYVMNDYVKAESVHTQVMQILLSSIKNIDSELLSSVLLQQGLIKFALGDFTTAEEYYTRVLNRTHAGDRSHYGVLQNLGLLYAEKGDDEMAVKYLTDALTEQKEFLGEYHIDYISCYYNLLALYRKHGEYSKAEDGLLYILPLIKAECGEQNTYYAAILNTLGNLYLDLCMYDKADVYYQQALDIYKQINPTSYKYARSLANYGLLKETLKNYILAEKSYAVSSMICKNVFLSSLNYLTEYQRSAYWNIISDLFYSTYPSFSYCYNLINPSISTFAYNNELFIKGLLLYSSESVKRSILESNDTTLINKWNEITRKKQQIQVLQEKNPQSDYLKQIQEEAEQLEKQITRSSAAYRENQALWQITWDSVRNHLSPNEVAIEYFSAPLSKDSTMYCALLLRHNSEYPELIPLFEEKEITSFIVINDSNITNNTYNFYANGDKISHLVWSKILPKIKESETIYFAPSGLLHQLAIEYLPYDEQHSMSDMYNMVRLSSTREIVKKKENIQHTKSIVYGGIFYDLDKKSLLAESRNYNSDELFAHRTISSNTTNRGTVLYLPWTKKEAESINSLLKRNNINSTLYTASKANEESFKSLSGKHNNILHIGTHGFAWTDSIAQKQDYFSQYQKIHMFENESYPHKFTIDPLERCGLLFAGANIALQGNNKNFPEGVQDGILTAKEISLMDLRGADLVVLSACETAKGDITSEGVFGLQRAFKMAGAQTIIMSLWGVDDQATQILMTEFYNNWIGKHQSKRDAFRNAQNTVRNQYEEPEYWAGFIMLD